MAFTPAAHWTETDYSLSAGQHAVLPEGKAFTPFKVTNFGTNREPICDFLLMINANVPHLAPFPTYGYYMSNFR